MLHFRVHKRFQRTSDLLLRNWIGMNVTFTFEPKHQQQREFHEKCMSSERGRLKNILNSVCFRHHRLCIMESQNMHQNPDFMHGSTCLGCLCKKLLACCHLQQFKLTVYTLLLGNG